MQTGEEPLNLPGGPSAHGAVRLLAHPSAEFRQGRFGDRTHGGGLCFGTSQTNQPAIQQDGRRGSLKEVILFNTNNENNKRILKKILELTYDKKSYYDNTHNKIDTIEASAAIKSWLEK